MPFPERICVNSVILVQPFAKHPKARQCHNPCSLILVAAAGIDLSSIVTREPSLEAGGGTLLPRETPLGERRFDCLRQRVIDNAFTGLCGFKGRRRRRQLSRRRERVRSPQR